MSAPCPACTDGACLICRADWHELAARINPTADDARELMSRTKLRRLAAGVGTAALFVAGAGCRASVETADGFIFAGVCALAAACLSVDRRWMVWVFAGIVLFMLGALVALGGWA